MGLKTESYQEAKEENEARSSLGFRLVHVLCPRLLNMIVLLNTTVLLNMTVLLNTTVLLNMIVLLILRNYAAAAAAASHQSCRLCAAP